LFPAADGTRGWQLAGRELRSSTEIVWCALTEWLEFAVPDLDWFTQLLAEFPYAFFAHCGQLLWTFWCGRIRDTAGPGP
jgi:hypothetical protein